MFIVLTTEKGQPIAIDLDGVVFARKNNDAEGTCYIAMIDRYGVTVTESWDEVAQHLRRYNRLKSDLNELPGTIHDGNK